MKHFLGFISIVLFFFGCSGETKTGYEITGTLEGDVADGTAVYLRKSDENMRPVPGDTTQLTNGTFRFTGGTTAPELRYIFVDGVNAAVPVIVEDGSIQIIAHRDSLTAATVTGTPQNEAYAEFVDGTRKLVERRNAINSEMQVAMQSRDTANINALRDEFFEFQESAVTFDRNFVKENSDALISTILVERMLQSGSVPVSEVSALFEGLDETLRQSPMGTRIKSQITSQQLTAIGSKAPDFSAPSPTGEVLALNQVLGKVTLVDFWAAWCRPCRAENPNIVRVYEKYKDRGLSVLGVSLDRNASDWKKAIQDDGLTWHHVSNVRYFDEIAELYNVRAIPSSFILDENGVIVAKNLRGQDLEAKIAELLP